MADIKEITHEGMRDLATELCLLKNRLLSVGMYKTYHAIDSATKAIGWEMAEIIEGKHVTKLVCPHGYQDFDQCPDCCH